MSVRVTCAGLIATALLSVPVQAAGAQTSTDPLELAIVVPVNTAPLFTAEGLPVEDAEERLTTMTDMVRSLGAPDLSEIPLALAPSPLLCDEALSYEGEAAEAFTTALREAAGRSPVLTSPYADVRLPHLGSAEDVRQEISAGRGMLETCTGVPPIDVLLPPDLALDGVVLEGAAEAGSPTALAPAALLTAGPTLFRDVTLLPSAYVSERDAPNDALVRFDDGYAVALVDPDRPDLSTFLSAVANDPRVDLVPLAEVPDEPASRFVSFPSLAPPPPSYTSALGRALSALGRLRSYTLAANRLVAVLETALGHARSSAEWDARWPVGRERANGIAASVARERRLVSATGGSVTFTSRRGSVPVTVTNDASYPVRLRINLSSPKLDFPEGSARMVTVEPPGDTIVFVALARSTGTFPVQVRVSSADGRIRFYDGELTVRSTVVNVSALVLTAGGAVFLAGWFLRQLRRRRASRGAR